MSVTPERWKEVEAVFERAVELSVDERAAFVQKNCNGDEELQREVESLLESHASAGSFIDERALFISDQDVAQDEEAVPAGHLIGAYRIIREIGRGGMGAVYLAERADEQYQKQVAIKLIKRGMDSDLVLRHFRRERQIMADLDHPNIARLFDGGTTKDGLPYFVMEYIEGAPINQYCSTKALSAQERLKLFLQVCAAVTYAHERTVVHRDIKPSNILVTTEGVPKLLDFGIAKILESHDGGESLISITGTRPMTPEYASPEQVRGEPVTTASDVYSLGVVLYELLTGSFPYRLTTRSPREIERAITEQEPTRPSTVVRDTRFEKEALIASGPVRTGAALTKVSSAARINSRALRGDLDNIVLMALRKEPERRYQSVEQFADDIRRHLESRPVLARPTRPPARIWRWSRRNPLLAGAAIACLFLGVAVAWLIRQQFFAPQRPPPEKSIAILPFAYLNADKTDAYLADGIQEEILTRLSKVADLKVISRSSTQGYRSKPEKLPEIARQLGVVHVLEGSIQKSADQLRVSVQLVNAQNESQLWAERYDRQLTDIFPLESEIATRIARALQAKLSGQEQRAINARPTENSEAHKLCLQARHLWEQRTDTALLKAIDYFNQALSLDPNYARAYAGIADCYLTLPFFSKLNPAECHQKAKLAASKALEIDSDLADAHVATAILAANEARITEGKREFLRAIELDPNYADAYQAYALKILVPLGQFDEAIAQFKHALELDPLSPPFNANFGIVYALARRYSDAITQLRRTIELDPAFGFGHGVLGYTLDASGQFDEAIPAIEKSYDLTHDFHPLGLLGYAYGRKGDGGKALQLLKQLQDLNLQNSDWNYGLAIIYLALGDKNEALHRLEEGYRSGEVGFNLYISVDPLLDPLRGDPAFEQLANRIVADFDRKPSKTVDEKSIAVLPFQNLSGDPENAYFADGIQEEILTRLSKIADLKVISRTSTQRYKNTSAPLSEIAQQLGVAHVLEGTVQKAADHVRVNVQLINAQADSQMWAEEFDRKLADIFAVESEIATRIAETFQARLSGAERHAISVHPTKNSQAHDLYLKGRYQWRNFYAPGYEHVREYYEQAIALDPSYAPAYVGLSLYHSWAAANGIFSPDHWPLAEDAVRKALSLDENLPEAYNALAAIEVYYKRDWAAAERAFHRGMELDPNFGDLHFHYGLCLSYLGRFSEAIEQTNRALELDPFFQGTNLHYGTVLFFSRDYDRAAAQLAKTIDLFPDYAAAHNSLGEVCAKRGMMQEAITHWCTALSLNGQRENAQLVEETFKRSGFDAAVGTLAEKQLQELDRKRARGDYVAPANYVFANVRRGNIEEAFKWLPKMVEEPDWFALQVSVNPVLDPLRADPRFEKIVNGGGD